MKVETRAEQLFFTTVRIESVGPAGSSCGTGFLFHCSDSSNPETGSFVIVTNKHVIAGGETGRFWFMQKDADGSPIVGEKWDIAINTFAEK